MSNISEDTVRQVEELSGKYEAGFVTDIEMEKAPMGLNEDIIRFISAKKEEPEWMLIRQRSISQKSITSNITITPRLKIRIARNLWTKSIRSCWKHTRSWAFLCVSRKC